MAQDSKPTSKSAGKMNIHLADEDAVATVKTILAYESAMRGRTIGQTCSELVMEAADISSYPEEIRLRLDEIAEASERRAVAKSLEMWAQ